MPLFSQHLMSYPFLMVSIPLFGLIMNGIIYKNTAEKGAKASSFLIGLGFFLSLACLIFIPHHTSYPIPSAGFKLDGLSLLMSTLVFFVSFIVHQYSRRYMAGDRCYRHYFLKLTAITSSLIATVFADNLILFWCGWIVSNLLLISLMVHKGEWSAAKFSGVLTLMILGSGSLLLFICFFLMYQSVGSFSITVIIAHGAQISTIVLTSILALLGLTALIQSAQWPFHRWLTSSLNSPTPVSALMHAGLVNGGGFLLVLFSPLFLKDVRLLDVLFVTGAISALLGTFWKLLQSDIKRMLAHSTMAQMGYMMMQCGLGLFPAAIAHICWHGLFKAYLFLNAGSALNAKKEKMISPRLSMLIVIISCLIGLSGALSFGLMSEKPLFSLQPTTFLIGFAFISGTQLAYTLFSQGSLSKRIFPVLVLVSLTGGFYGESIHLVESFFPSYAVQALAPLSFIHWIVFTLFFSLWLCTSLSLWSRLLHTRLWRRLYVSALNGSQPHPRTITAIRKTYHF